jgi:bifunctional non-homologous end joining protein LigD
MTQKADLHFTGGGSDKVYHLLQNGADLHVAYGRRGSGLNISKQTLASEVKAATEFQKKFMEKLNKGYQIADGISGNIWGHRITVDPGSGDTTVTAIMKNDVLLSVTDTSTRRTEKIPSGFLPQLLNEISEEEAQQYINDDAWGAQEKKNGRRHTVLIDLVNKEPRAANKLGFLIPTFVTFRKPVDSLQLDGEAIGSKLYIFDILRYNQYSYKDITYRQRFNALVNFHIQYGNASTEIIPLYEGTRAKQRLWDKVKANGGEGVVFKRLDAIHKPGRPNRLGDQLKVIFWQHTQARVVSITEGKRSVALICWNSQAHHWVDVGNVTIPANYDMPLVGDYVEIRYKYYYEGGSLFQPQYEGTTDVATDLDTDFNKLLRFTGEGE